MQKLTKEQAQWLINRFNSAFGVDDSELIGISACKVRDGAKQIISQCTEKEFPAFSFETQDHRIISMHQVVNRAALNNEFFLDKAELMHLVLGIEKIIDWMEEQE